MTTIDHRHTLNIVLLGQTGTGKSASGNLIMKTNPFKSCPSSVPVTRECQVVQRQIAGTKVRVTDTPDFYDENIEQSDKHLMECRGPSTFIIMCLFTGYSDWMIHSG